MGPRRIQRVRTTHPLGKCFVKKQKKNMKLTSRNVKQGLVGAVTAATAYLGYHLFGIWATRKVNLHELQPETESLPEDREMFYLFVQMSEVRDDVNPSAFRHAVLAADRLVHLKLQLEKKRIKPSLRDVPEAAEQVFICKDALDAFMRETKSKKKAETIAKVYRLYQRLYDCLHRNYVTIMRISRQT